MRVNESEVFHMISPGFCPTVGFCWKKMVGLGGLRNGRWHQVVALDPLDDLAHGPGVVEAVTSPRVELLPFKGPKDHGIFHMNHQRRFIYKLNKGDLDGYRFLRI